MNKILDYINKNYLYNKYEINGKSNIFSLDDKKIVVKEEKGDIKKLYSYLKSRDFNNIPNLIDSNYNYNIYEYINDYNYPKEQRASDLIKIVANLHKKTSYNKDVTEDTFKEIYDLVLNNIMYYLNRYDEYFNIFFKEIYQSPSHYLFMRNYSVIKNNLIFCKNELNNWYDLVKNLKTYRVSVIHNNLSLNHLLKNDKAYLISFDNNRVDTPIMDIVKLYKKEYFDLDFNELLNNYFSIFNYSDDELKLFFILISLGNEITFEDSEFINTYKLRNNLDYLFKTEKLIRPYYLKDKKEENTN